MTVYFFGPGRDGCHDCAHDENGKPLCTMNCGSRMKTRDDEWCAMLAQREADNAEGE